MVINNMMYRVFLQDEKDAPGPNKNPENHFRIRYGETLAWYYNCPVGWKPTLEQQLKSASYGTEVGPSSKQLDGHWLIKCGGTTIGVVYNTNELPEKTYKLSLERAQELTKLLTEEKGKPYQFIDVTSKGDKNLARELSKKVHPEHIYVASPRAVDIGD